MTDGRYLYCILDGGKKQNFGKIGIGSRQVYSVGYRDISGVVSSIPFKEMEPNVDDIAAHQKVVEAARKLGTVLPVRFGVLFKNEKGVEKLLSVSYKDFKSKIAKFKGKHELGVKIVLEKANLGKLERLAEDESEEIRKIKQELSSASLGESYFLKLTLNEAVKSESLKRIDEIAGEIHRELSKAAEDARRLKTDLDQIVLNGAYLVDRRSKGTFDLNLKALRERYENKGLMFHVSGPWAPYSFC